MKQNKTKKEGIEFENTTYGGMIDALVKYYTGMVAGTFVLERALEEVKKNNQKIEEFKQSLLKDKKVSE